MKPVLPAIALAALAAAPAAQAQSRAEFAAAFMDNCQSAGNAAADCACIAQNWSNDLSDDDLPLAIAAIEMSYADTQPDINMINLVLPMVMGLTDYTLRCAAGEFGTSETGPRADIPQTGDAAEEALLRERLSAGEATLEEMMRYDQLVMDRRDADRAAADAAQAAKDTRAAEARETLRADYDAEFARIHAQSVPDLPIAEFETLFTLQCQMGGNSDAACNCGWDQVTDLAKTYALAYLASRPEGDDVLDHIPPADLYGTYPALSLLNERRAVCDDL